MSFLSQTLEIHKRGSLPEVFCEKVFLEISQNSQENPVTLFNKVAGLRSATLSKSSVIWRRLGSRL